MHQLCVVYNNRGALTHCTGVRLYFSTTPFAPPNARQSIPRPSFLALVHVRLPPGFSASSTLQKPAKVHKALYNKGKSSDSETHKKLKYLLDLNLSVSLFVCFIRCFADGNI